jgi:transcriptional regulator with XRE-family HTH domain
MSFREMRLKAGLSVAQVMEKMGVSRAAVCQWETGIYTPRADKLPEIAKLYGCTVDDLLRKEDGE